MKWPRFALLFCEQGHRCDLVADWPFPERAGRLICPRCERVLTANVPARPDEREFLAYPRLLRKTLLVCLLGVSLVVTVIWLSVNRTAIRSIVASPAGRHIAVSASSVDGDGEVYLLHSDTVQRTDLVHGKRMAGRLAFAPDGHTLAVAVAESESQPRPGKRGLHIVGTIQLWDLSSLRQRAVLRGHKAAITALAFTPDSRALFSMDAQHVLKCWQTASGREQASQKMRLAFQRMALSLDERTLAIGNTAGTVALLDTTIWRLKSTFGAPAASSAITGLAFTPDGQTLATAGVFNQQVKLWDTSNGAPRATLAVPANWLTCLAFAPDGQALAVGTGFFGRRGEVKLFDLPSGRERFALPVHTNTVTTVAFSADGETVIAGSGYPISLLSRPRNSDVYRWSAKTGLPLERGR